MPSLSLFEIIDRMHRASNGRSILKLISLSNYKLFHLDRTRAIHAADKVFILADHAHAHAYTKDSLIPFFF